ncbi:MAG: 2-nitropropane dioxygenase [Rhodospirillaceae bacterium]|nr:2-nitropropane dioxygenase [Rhodospirillaceae bacterium]
MLFSNVLENNELCRMLGVRYPVCQAGMYSVAYGKLAAAVSNAGGLGVIGSAFMDPEQLRREIQLVKRETDKPYGVDILFAEVSGGDETASGYTREVEDHIAVTFEEGCSVIVSGLGDPGRIVPRAHEAGMKVMSLVGTSRQAKKVEASGVDAVIASGHEGGGHVGRVGTLPLVAKVVDSVDIPVLAAGGISDGRGLIAALALGAKGVWMGTRFIATEEARGHLKYKQKIVDIDEDGTIVTRGHSGKTARVIRNKFTDYWAGHEEAIKPFPYQLREVGEPASIRGRMEGDVEHGVLAAGQGSGVIGSIPPAGQVVEAIMAEAKDVLDRWTTG